MYRMVSDGDGQRLTDPEREPDLHATDRFWQVLETLPDECGVPLQLVKLGLLSDQLWPADADYEVNFTPDEYRDASHATVPPDTLSAIRWLLFELSDELADEQKQRIGVLCDATDLDRRPREGANPDTVRQTTPDTYDHTLDFIEEVESDEQSISRGRTGKHDPFSTGKEVTKQGRGGERIVGKNPHADSKRIKDTGLHQGGG